MTGRPPPPPIDWDILREEDSASTSLWRAAMEVIRFVFTGKGVKS